MKTAIALDRIGASLKKRLVKHQIRFEISEAEYEMLERLREIEGFDGKSANQKLFTFLLRLRYENRFLTDKSAHIVEKAVAMIKAQLPLIGVESAKDLDMVGVNPANGNIQVKVRGETGVRIFAKGLWDE